MDARGAPKKTKRRRRRAKKILMGVKIEMKKIDKRACAAQTRDISCQLLVIGLA